VHNQEQEQQFLTIIDQNKGIIYKIARSFKKDDDDLQDLVQEIVLQLWLSFSNYDGRAKLSTWLYRVALNVSIGSYRRERKKNDLLVPLQENMIDFVDEEAPDSTNLHLLQQFIAELKELDRALMLLYLEEKSGKEMAEILGLSEANIRVKINRIKEKLKQRFLTVNN